MRRELGADDTPEFAGAEDLRELHGALASSKSVEQFLHEMAVLAARLVSGGLSCGMTMQPSGRPVTVACSDQDATLIEQLRSSLASRMVIDQALGIIMARERCTQARAFAILRSASRNSNTKLRDIASAVVTSVTGEPPQPWPPFGDGQS